VLHDIPAVTGTAMGDEKYMDEFDDYNYGVEYDKMEERMKVGGHAKHKGKQKHDPSGNVRKVVSNIQNAEKKDKEMRKRAIST